MIRKFTYGKSDKVIIFLAGWKTNRYHFWIFVKLLQFNGFEVHLYTFSKSFFSPSINKTLENFKQAEYLILKDVDKLEKCRAKVVLYGVSLGSVLALMIANKRAKTHKLILNLTGLDLVQTVWEWGERLNPEFKEHFEVNKVTLSDLQKGWEYINPKNNLEKIINKDVLLYLSKNDEVITYKEGKRLVDALKQQGNTVKLVRNLKLHHITSGTKNLFNFPVYLRFLSS